MELNLASAFCLPCQLSPPLESLGFLKGKSFPNIQQSGCVHCRPTAEGYYFSPGKSQENPTSVWEKDEESHRGRKTTESPEEAGLVPRLLSQKEGTLCIWHIISPPSLTQSAKPGDSPAQISVATPLFSISQRQLAVECQFLHHTLFHPTLYLSPCQNFGLHL